MGFATSLSQVGSIFTTTFIMFAKILTKLGKLRSVTPVMSAKSSAVPRADRIEGPRGSSSEGVPVQIGRSGIVQLIVLRPGSQAPRSHHRGKEEFDLLDVKQAKRSKDLEVENTGLKRIVADQVLED